MGLLFNAFEVCCLAFVAVLLVLNPIVYLLYKNECEQAALQRKERCFDGFSTEQAPDIKTVNDCTSFVLDPISFPQFPFTVLLCFNETVPQFLRLDHQNFTRPIVWPRTKVLRFQVFGFSCLMQLIRCTRAVALNNGQDPFCAFVAVFGELVVCYSKGFRGLSFGYVNSTRITARELDYLFQFATFWFKSSNGEKTVHSVL